MCRTTDTYLYIVHKIAVCGSNEVSFLEDGAER